MKTVVYPYFSLMATLSMNHEIDPTVNKDDRSNIMDILKNMKQINLEANT